MNNNELKTQLQQAFNDCIAIIGRYADDELNAPQGAGRWTKAQLAQHVVIATGTGFDAHTKPADRPHDQWAGEIEAVFADHSQKYNAPEMTRPELKPYHKTDLTAWLKKNLADIEEMIATKDLTEQCTDIPLPGWGHLTRYEWLVLILFHLKRHTKQLNDK
jgi:hypothetical protein